MEFCFKKSWKVMEFNLNFLAGTLYNFFFGLSQGGETLNARTAVNTARTVWDSPKCEALPTKTPPKLVNRQSFTLESQRKIRLQNQLRKS